MWENSLDVQKHLEHKQSNNLQGVREKGYQMSVVKLRIG